MNASETSGFSSLEGLTGFTNSSGFVSSNVTQSYGNASMFNTSTSSPGSSGGGGVGGSTRSITMTKETSDDITSTLQCYVFPIITLIGLTGNILSLLVLLQKKMRASTTSLVLIGLAMSDILFLITNAVRKSTCIIERFDPSAAAMLNATTFYYMFYLKTAFSRVSTLIVVLISIERLIAVAFPLKIKSIVTRTKMFIAVIFCYVVTFAGLAGLPPQYTYAFSSSGRPRIAMTPFAYENAIPLKAYNEYFLPIVYRHAPVCLVLIINSLIIFLLGRSNRFQKSVSKQDSKRSDEQKKITRMLLSVALVFLICLLPGDVLLVASLVVDGFTFFGFHRNLFAALSDISLCFEMVNSCANFIIYMLLNRNFYNTFVRLFCCCVTYIRSRNSTTTSSKTRDTTETSASMKVKCQQVGNVVTNDESSISVPEMAEVKGNINDAYIE